MTSAAAGYLQIVIRIGARFGRTILLAPLGRKARQLADEAVGPGGGLWHLTAKDIQLYHNDHRDDRQAKVFINHYGNRANRLDRFVLLVSFARANSVKSVIICRVLESVRKRLVSEFYDSEPVGDVVLDTPV